MNYCLMPRCCAEVHLYGDVCDDCWTDRRGQLAALPDLFVMTYAQLAPGGGTRELALIDLNLIDPAAPMNLSVFDDLARVHGRVGAWAAWALRVCEPYAEPLHLNRLPTGTGMVRAVRVLQAYDHKFALQSYAGEYVLDIWRAYRCLVVRCVPTSPRHLDIACPNCDTTSVVTRHADEFAVCLTCGDEWPHSRLPTLRGMVAAR